MYGVGGVTLSDIDEMKEDIPGIKSAFLLKGEEVLEKDSEFNIDIIKEISLLTSFIRDKEGELRELLIVGDHQFAVFLHDSYAVGVITEPDIDVRVLHWMARRILRDLSLPVGMSSEQVRRYFRSEYRSLQKEVLKLLYEIKELKDKNRVLEQKIGNTKDNAG